MIATYHGWKPQFPSACSKGVRPLTTERRGELVAMFDFFRTRFVFF